MIIKAKKSLGQNFLFDRQILEIISNCAEIKDKDILEVGPDTGYLTNGILLKKPKSFLAKKLSSSINNQIDNLANVLEEKAIWQRFGL